MLSEINQVQKDIVWFCLYKILIISKNKSHRKQIRGHQEGDEEGNRKLLLNGFCLEYKESFQNR